MTEFNAVAHFRTATVSNGWHQDPDHAHITRGIQLEPDDGWHPDAAHRILSGTATHHDVLHHVNTDHVGHYWWTHNASNPGALDDPKLYAEPREPISNWTKHAEPGENVLGGAGVVLVGHRPHGWNPVDNPNDGLMGNSTLPDHSHIPLHEIHYSGDGENWHSITPPAGTTVHTDGPPHSATAYFREERDGHEAARTAGRGRPRRQPGAGSGAAGAGEDTAGAAPAVGADQAGAGPVSQREVSFHPAAKKELLKLDGDSRKRVANTINALQRGDEGLQTHALTSPLKGWNSTKASRGHRVIHRDLDDGTLHIGYVGLHEYDKAINRLSSLTDFFREATLQQTSSVDENDYRMQHRAPGPDNAPLHDPTRPNGDGGAFHQESLDNPDWGEIGEPHEESLAAVHRAKGNPNAPVTIYRSAPHGVSHIHTGDWVSTSAQYAREHGMHHDDPSKDWPVLKATVPAHHVHTDGNDINEWGYNGPAIEHAAVHGPDEEWTEPTHHTRTAASQMTEAEEQLLQRQAAAVANDDGIMVAFVPPHAIAEQLAQKDGQLADDLHITLAYLGNMADYTKEQLTLLPQLVSAWAMRQKPVTIRIGGVGTFNNAFKDQHVLWAHPDIPGGVQMHVTLARELERYKFRLPSEHGWTAHMTLRYTTRHDRFMPQLPEVSWEATEVVTFIGSARHAARLGLAV